MGKDYYAILGISSNADKDTVKKAYRKLALEYHPDKNKDKSGVAKFQEIGEAYEVLKNKRTIFEEDLKGRGPAPDKGRDPTLFKGYVPAPDKKRRPDKAGGAGGFPSNIPGSIPDDFRDCIPGSFPDSFLGSFPGDEDEIFYLASGGGGEFRCW
ncbi:hypothetical protein HPULCUR_002847 [Helicostylum pulchrum]|uniref:J domain-containing protein n=1 Tax=Helicostylum pulchrum TaxID=562976 RepID=A0ABP9XSS3_9FUNG